MQGSELCYNNLLDADAAFELVAEFDPKQSHAVRDHQARQPVRRCDGADHSRTRICARVACDPVSRFGGIIALNGTLDAATAEEIVKIVTDVIVVPAATDEARDIIAKQPAARLLVDRRLARSLCAAVDVRSVAGGLLVQTRDDADADKLELKVVTKTHADGQGTRRPPLRVPRRKHVKSNTIVYAKDGATVGIGAGQMSRVDSARIAAWKAKEAADAAGLKEPMTRGSVAASDAFFPFADGLLATIEAGATAVIQPGGSMRDDEVIKAADDAGIAMVFSGVRQFRH